MSKRVNRIIALALATNILFSSAGALTFSKAIDSNEKPGVYDGNIKYKDGVYIGEGEGFNKASKLKVRVEIKDGKIKSINYLEDSGDYTYPDDRQQYQPTAAKLFDILLKDPQYPYKAKKDIEKHMEGGDFKLVSTEYAAVTGASYTARGISRAVVNALDIARKAAENTKTVIGLSFTKKPTTNIYLGVTHDFSNSEVNRIMLGDEIYLNEFEVKEEYSDGTYTTIPYEKLKEHGYTVTHTNSYTKEKYNVIDKKTIKTDRSSENYKIEFKKDSITKVYDVISITRNFVENDLKYQIGKDGEWKNFNLKLEDESDKKNYDVKEEAVRRPLGRQTHEVISVKSSDIGEKVYFKTTGYTNTITGTQDILKKEQMEFNYTPLEITKDMSDVRLLRRVTKNENIEFVSFDVGFDNFRLKFNVVEDKDDQVNQAKNLKNEIDKIKEDGLSKEKLEALKKLKAEAEKLDSVINKAGSTSKEVKDARLALNKAYEAYKNHGKKQEQGSSGRPSSSNSDKKDDDKKINSEVRISGEDRISTSVEISKKTYQNADTVILTNGYKNSDALTAGALASKMKAPILFTEKEKVSEKVLGEIKRLNAKNVIIIGGDESVSEKIKSSLKGLKIERISGADRYETSSKVAQKLYDLNKNNRVILVNGLSLVDALSTPSLGDDDKGAILLTEDKKLNKFADDFIRRNKVERALVLGGENSISSKVESGLKDLNVKTKRIYGSDRYETSRKIAQSVNNRDEIVFASGENYVDSLSASPYVEKNKSALVLTSNKANLGNEKDVIKKLGAKKLSFIGGKNSLSDNLIKELLDFDKKR